MRNRRNAFQLNGAGLFLAVVDSWECELEPGTFYPPRGAVEAPMPEGWLTQDEDGLWPSQWPADQWPRFNGVLWELVPRPAVPQPLTPQQKLDAFVTENPDVAPLVATPHTTPQPE